MKRIFLLFAMVLTFSSSLISCRETPNESTEVELNNDELEVDDQELNNSDAQGTSTEVPREEGAGDIDDF